MPNDNHQFTTEEILYRIVLPAISAMWAVTKIGSANQLGQLFLAAVIVAGVFFTFQQSLEALDRRLNTNLYEKGLA